MYNCPRAKTILVSSFKTWCQNPSMYQREVQDGQDDGGQTAAQAKCQPRGIAKTGRRRCKGCPHSWSEWTEKLLSLLNIEGTAHNRPDGLQQAWEPFQEYQDIFALKPGKIGCYDIAMHTDKLIKDKPFKECYWLINPCLNNNNNNNNLFLLLSNSTVMYAICSFYMMPVVYTYRRSGQVLKPVGLSA